MRSEDARPLHHLPVKVRRKLQWYYRRWFQYRCHVYVHRGPFPPEQRSDCTFQRYERFEDVPLSLRDAIVANRNSKELDIDALEIKDNAVMWVASCDGVPATIVFTRRGRHFRRWFLPLQDQDVVVFRLRTYPPFRGRGLAPSLMRHVLHESVKDGAAAYVDCRVYNQPSIRSITKAGFECIATMKPIPREQVVASGGGSDMGDAAAVYVLGMTCNGLSVVRSLGRRGLRVHAIDSYLDRPGLRSRYCDVIAAPTNVIDNEEPWLSFLIGLASLEPVKPVLFPTEDAYVLFIAKHRDVLSQYYEFNVAPDNIVDAAVSKLGTYRLAVQCDVPTPWTYLIRTLSDYREVADKVTFPCALKPSYAHVWLKNYRPEKLLVINEPQELNIHLRALDELGIEVVLQEIIPGGDDHVYVFPAYVSRDRRVLGYANLRKLRQRPVDFGVGAFDITVNEPNLTEVALKLIGNSGFTGMASTEYKLDPRDGKFKLIDINPRTCMIGELAIASGVDLPYLYYRDMCGQGSQLTAQSTTGTKWLCFEWDVSSFLEYRRRRKLGVLGWLSSLRGPKVYAYFACDDLRPFIAASVKFVRRSLRYLSKRILSKHTRYCGPVIPLKSCGSEPVS